MTSTIKFDRWYNTNDELVADGTYGFPNGRNLLYNGAMQVAQRGTSATGLDQSNSSYHTVDRWRIGNVGLGTWTQTVENDGPTGSGFTKSLKMECTAADAAPAAGDFLVLNQLLEGQDLQGLKKGTSSAESITLSFWVKSNVTGTYIAELYDADNTRQVSASYTVSSSGTWEKKTITFAGDTTGAFDNDNASSLRLFFWLGAGSDFTSGTLNTSWASEVTANRSVGQVNVAASTSNYWQVTGVQLEAGTVATAFEHKAYGVELAECQRYYWRNAPGVAFAPVGQSARAQNSTTANPSAVFPTTMRATPTSVEFSNLALSLLGVNDFAINTLTLGQAGQNGAIFGAVVSSGLSGGVRYDFTTHNLTTGYLALSAEL